MSGLYVTGTDTGIGKTVASAALLHALRMRSLRAVGMKPLASGCEAGEQGWRNEDALALLAASDPRPAYDDLNPYALPAPLAPEIAAREAGVAIDPARLDAAFARLRAQADHVVVEGVGGWAAPLSATLDQADLARRWELPVVLVVGLRLGCINHARLTARAIAADGLPLLGWIANEVDPAMARLEENLALLQDRLHAPCLGRIPHRPQAEAAQRGALLRLPADFARPGAPAPLLRA
ncbi:dethiobiotin synthase [Pseudoxanthomonas mexicana]|uniref:dethiobiotin synthase n=1 Tax=Pseudoxanthomonas mexicana TaxID=128785 RepID=UPI00398BBA3C